MKVGERVVVDAAVTGDGIHHSGIIFEMCEYVNGFRGHDEYYFKMLG